MPNEPGKRIHESKRQKFTGRGKDHSFLRLPHFVLDSDEFAALSGNATKLLLDAAKEYKGKNNGDINLTWRRLVGRGWASQGTAHRAKNELLGSGFLLCTRHGGKNRCSLFAISWEPIDVCPGKGLELQPERTASHRWRKRDRCSEMESTSLRKSEQSGEEEDG